MNEEKAKGSEEEVHIEIGPRVLNDFNVKIGSAVFHLHKFALYSCNYFKTLFDQNLPEYDLKKNESTPTLTLPDDFLSEFNEDDRRAMLQEFFEYVYDPSQLDADRFEKWENWRKVESFTYCVHYFDCPAVEKRLIAAWVKYLEADDIDDSEKDDESRHAGCSIRLGHKYHLDEVKEAAVKQFKSLFGVTITNQVEAEAIETFLSSMGNDSACLQGFVRQLLGKKD